MHLYINRGTYVPASVCRGEAVATPTHGEAAYNLVYSNVECITLPLCCYLKCIGLPVAIIII